MRNLLLAVLVACALTAAPQDSGKQALAADPNKALIGRYCVTCHNTKLKTAKLDLSVLDLAHPEKDAVIWERAIRKL